MSKAACPDDLPTRHRPGPLDRQQRAAADLIGFAPTAYSHPKYVTCLGLGSSGTVFTEGWERKVVLTGIEGKELKTQINTQWIYPPVADRATARTAADPQIPVVA